jgi:hypothetical protein
VKKIEEHKHWWEGWSLGEMEVRNNGTEFFITKEPDVALTKDVAVGNLLTYVQHVFKCFEGIGPKRHLAFF